MGVKTNSKTMSDVKQWLAEYPYGQMTTEEILKVLAEEVIKLQQPSNGGDIGNVIGAGCED